MNTRRDKKSRDARVLFGGMGAERAAARLTRVLLGGLGGVLTAVALAACGGDDSPEPGVVSAPEPDQALEEHLERVNGALATGDCKTFVEESFSQGRNQPRRSTELIEPGAPATKRDCAPPTKTTAKLMSALEGIEFTVTKESGPAAVSEGTADVEFQGYGHWAQISLVDRDRQWRALSYFQVEPQDESPPRKADPGAVVDEFLTAVRADDCKDADAIFDPLGRLAGGSFKLADPNGAARACKTVVNGALFAPSLKQTREADARPEELLTTRDISIWGIPTKEAYYAVFLGTPPHRIGAPPESTFLVSDVVVLTEATPDRTSAS